MGSSLGGFGELCKQMGGIGSVIKRGLLCSVGSVGTYRGGVAGGAESFEGCGTGKGGTRPDGSGRERGKRSKLPAQEFRGALYEPDRVASVTFGSTLKGILGEKMAGKIQPEVQRGGC